MLFFKFKSIPPPSKGPLRHSIKLGGIQGLDPKMFFSLCRLMRKMYISTVAYSRLGQSKTAAVSSRPNQDSI